MMHVEAVAIPDDEDNRVRSVALVLKLRSLGVTDRALFRAIESVPRTLFVSEEWRRHAYHDRPLPIACGQTITAPSVVGMMAAALDATDRHSVLEVGTGSGYQTAILSRLARRVTTLERFRTLLRSAEARWQTLGIHNVSAVLADGALGWSRQAPFDRIIVNAASAAPPVRLIAQLTDSGILIAPIGPAEGAQRLTLFQRRGQEVDTRDLGEARFLPLAAGVAQNL